MSVKAIESVGPLRTRSAEPVVHRYKSFDPKSRRAALTLAGSFNEASPLQDLEVSSYRRLRHVER
jgi:hypothetical protein